MKQQQSDYQVVPYSKIRRIMAAGFRLSHHMPLIHGLLEVDVSGARAFLRDHKAKTGESLSFTAFLIACLETDLVRAFGPHATYGGTGKVTTSTHYYWRRVLLRKAPPGGIMSRVVKNPLVKTRSKGIEA